MLSISGRFLPPQEEEEEDPAAEWEQDVDAVCRSIRPTMPRRTAPAGGRFDHPCTDGVKILEIEEEEEEETFGRSSSFTLLAQSGASPLASFQGTGNGERV